MSVLRTLTNVQKTHSARTKTDHIGVIVHQDTVMSSDEIGNADCVKVIVESIRIKKADFAELPFNTKKL